MAFGIYPEISYPFLLSTFLTHSQVQIRVLITLFLFVYYLLIFSLVMALRNIVPVSCILMIVCFGACSATVYTVGGDEGWTSSGAVDYNEWTSSKLFHVGDEFIFNYKHEDDFVTLVTEVDYDHCISPSLALSDYGGLTTLTFNKPGTYYVICGEPGHCEAGQKIKIKINAAEVENSISSPRPSPSP